MDFELFFKAVFKTLRLFVIIVAAVWFFAQLIAVVEHFTGLDLWWLFYVLFFGVCVVTNYKKGDS